MSYDLEVHTPQRHNTTSVVWERNMTTNIQSMLTECGLRLLDLDGMLADDAWDEVSRVIGVFVEGEDSIRKLEPENGWGTYEHCLLFLRELRAALNGEPVGAVLLVSS